MDPFEKFLEDNPGMTDTRESADTDRWKAFLKDRLQVAFASGQRSGTWRVAMQPDTDWTEKIKFLGEKSFKLGEMAFAGAGCEEALAEINTKALGIAREQDTEITRLNGLLGVEATDEAVDEHLMLYGTAYLYHGRLLDPTKVGIKRLKLSSTNLLKDLGADSLEVIVLNDGPIALKARAWWDEGLLSSQAFFRGELVETRDPYNLVLERLRANRRKGTQAKDEAMAIVRDFHALYFEDGKPKMPPTDMAGIAKDGMAMIGLLERANKLLGEPPCPKEADSKTSSTGDSPSTPAKGASTTASPEDGAESDTCPFAEPTSERSPKDKPASGPQ